MLVGITRVGHVNDFAVQADEEADPARHFSAHHPHIVKVNDFAVGIGQQAEIQMAIRDELFVAPGGIKTDADDGHVVRLQIAHAVAASPEGPYEVIGTVLAPRGPGFWDATTCHNPHIQKVGDRYALFYMGNSNGKTDTKRIGLATADSLAGPWRRPDHPLLEPGEPGAWDDHCTTNPSFVRHPNGQYWLYYKSWNTHEYETGTPPVRGNRKYGVAVADRLEGPYRKHPANPLIDFSGRGGNRQCEDAFVWHEDGKFRIVVRDMGVFNSEVGLYMESDDGLRWSEPKIAYRALREYVDQPPPPPQLNRYGRAERPQLLMRGGRPAYLFTASQGGRFMTASGFLFKIV